MITLNSADSALKSFYLDAISEALNYKANPFLAKLQQSSSDVVGKDVRKVFRNSFEDGIAAGTETGDLPKAYKSKYQTFVAPLKNLYGTIEISDKALRASANNEGAFVNILNEEMNALIKNATYNFSRMVFGDGNGSIATIQSIVEGEITVDNIRPFYVGMKISLGVLEAYEECIVEEVNKTKSTIRVYCESGGYIDDVVLPAGTKAYLYGAKGNELTGLEAIFSDKPLYGVARSVEGMKPYTANVNNNAITENDIQTAIDNVEERTGCKVDMIFCSWGVRRVLQDYYRKAGVEVPMMKAADGEMVMHFNGIPVYVDRFCPKGTMYLLTTENFKLHQLCDWQWLEAEDGKILKQLSGKPVYQATLVKYAELLCENPGAQAMIQGIAETV